MRTFSQWMDEYQVSHNHPVNKKIHKVCVPLIMLTVLGFLWAIPTPDFFLQVPFLNWATIFTLLCLIFYFSLNAIMALTMLVMTGMMLWICHLLDQAGVLLSFSIVVFVLSWIGQFYGHKLEGKKPSFFQDLAFLLIGPLWVMRSFYGLIGIRI